MSNNFDSYVIRRATSADAEALERLAQLDSARPLEGQLLVGESAGEIRAAVAVESGRTLADPFHRTAELRSLLEARASQVRRGLGRRSRIALRTASPALGGRRAAA